MRRIKNICCIGAGYVGGPTMAVIALKCPDIKVTVVDKNQDKIDAWNSKDVRQIPVYEPGLSEIVKEVRGENLFFSTDIDTAIEKSEIIFIAVNTPTKEFGVGKGMAADLKFVEQCARRISKVAKSDKIIVEKSTLPVRTAEALETIFNSTNKTINFEVISNPEFLAEGTAIQDLFKSDRVLIGGNKTTSGNEAVEALVNIYKKWIPKDKIITTNIWSSELSKLASNAFLAQRISSINALSALCEATGADIDEVALSVGKDQRIGNKFLKTSVGFGGSCFQKDILNLVYLCKTYQLDEVANYWEQVVTINNYQKNRFAEIIIKTLFNTVTSKKIGILGWAFKKNTDDTRESASIYVTDRLIEDGAKVCIYDPKVSSKKVIIDLTTLWESRNYPEDKIQNLLKQVEIVKTADGVINNAHGVAILTEWDDFTKINWEANFSKMKQPAFLFDGRNILDSDNIYPLGYQLYQIGKSKN